ncbi:hypothetical protein G4Y73_09015 [Wenzhouxiangella sp. XN201]|uniref:hypothetical protein n=1 Tax=Wenzhouxiangella sp. XN201 TaxID=2710755 RepID=UPI0013CBBB3A|nr:hypothetical protein [Wenzhouxiangella sp. XN201]NEZ04283.1 hypothetical protein [Wenzhouxiangella sp. XN201]
MRDQDSKHEPYFSDSDESKQADHDPLFDSRQSPREELDPRIRLAAFAVVFICSVFFIEWGIQKYHEYRANQAMKEMMADLEKSVQASAAQLRATTERNRREAERKHLALREQRANTSQGKWLAKNCADWRRAHESLQAPTAEAEMKRHCDLYEKYLSTGIAATPAGK